MDDQIAQSMYMLGQWACHLRNRLYDERGTHKAREALEFLLDDLGPFTLIHQSDYPAPSATQTTKEIIAIMQDIKTWASQKLIGLSTRLIELLNGEEAWNNELFSSITDTMDFIARLLSRILEFEEHPWWKSYT